MHKLYDVSSYAPTFYDVSLLLTIQTPWLSMTV